MKGIVAKNGELIWTDLQAPEPGPGQVLVKTLTCGICGTDLHARGHIHDFLKGLAKSGTPLSTDPENGIVFGHEFCGEILDHGRGGQKFKVGTRVVGLPFLTGPRGAEYVGYSDAFPGGFAERMVLTEKLLFEVPNGLPSEHAALTEPFSVGAHAVARAGRDLENAAIMVIGCGPIGLAVIAALKARGVGPVIGLDYSAGRRAFAEAMGADEVVDPTRETQTEVWARYKAGKRGPRAVAFECVGRPGVAQTVIDEAPANALVMVIGNVLEDCYIDQVIAFNKELDIRFSMNYSPAEFKTTLDDLAEGRIATDNIITDIISPENTPQAFEDLKDPEKHAKIVVKFD